MWSQPGKPTIWRHAFRQAGEVLPVSRDYFRLRRPLGRRVYEIGRKHCGGQDKWRISIDSLDPVTRAAAVQ